MILDIKELDKKYETIKDNRIKFSRDCFNGHDYNFLKKWDVIYDSKLTEEFILYILKKENIIVYEVTKKKRKTIKKKSDIFKKFKKISSLSSGLDLDRKSSIDYFYHSLKNIEYQDWQELKSFLLVIKKHLDDYIRKEQKKKICSLTDCYKENILTRMCELCGNSVQKDAVYCSQCGGEI